MQKLYHLLGQTTPSDLEKPGFCAPNLVDFYQEEGMAGLALYSIPGLCAGLTLNIST